MKSLFTSSDPRITPKKINELLGKLKYIVEALERIEVEVEMLRDSNIAMAKTIKKGAYRVPPTGDTQGE